MKASELSKISLGLIGGTGALNLFSPKASFVVTTDWGDPSSALTEVSVGRADASMSAWMIQRHGNPHRIPPHRVNYRANIDALKQAGVQQIISINAVGGIDPNFAPGDLVLVDQLIDYTWGRAHTFSDDVSHTLEHVEFGNPYEGRTFEQLKVAAKSAGVAVHVGGCYGATQGPRLETAAEIKRMAHDGCDVVGMTGMPEAGLAREAGLDYASICIIANPAAGLEAEPIRLEELHAVLDRSMGKVAHWLSHFQVASPGA
mgnify:FL=1